MQAAQMSTQLPWEYFRQGVDAITPRESRRLIRKMVVDGDGAMRVAQLSAIVPFHVGNVVSSGSWGRRFSRKKNLDANERLWKAQDFHREKMIGSGFFGEVHRATFVGHDEGETFRRNDQIAIKSFKKDKLLSNQVIGNPSLGLMRREIAIHSSISHHNIVKFYGFYEDPIRCNLVMEYCPEGDLLDCMKRYDPSSRQRHDIAQDVLAQISSALAYLGRLHCAHRDIKPENILVRKSHQGGNSMSTSATPFTCALADFGWACWWENGELRRTLCGTPEYLPVEMVSSLRYYEAKYVDAWALGVLACELMTGKTPFAPDDDDSSDESDSVCCSARQTIYNKILSFRLESYFANRKHQWGAASDFCQKLLQRNPTKRMTAESALQHAFLRSEAVPAIVSPMPASRG